MVKTKNKNLYKVKNYFWTQSKESLKIIFGTDRKKSLRFFCIVKYIVNKELYSGKGSGLLAPVYTSGIGVGFAFKKDYDYFITKALKVYYETEN
jgi:hypothetical protein